MSNFLGAAVSMRWLAVYQRNLLVWRKLAIESVLANIADPLIMFVAFGYGLGRLVGEVGEISYIAFLAGGAILMSAAMAASFESLYSAFSRMHVQRTWESLLNAPLELDDIFIAEWLWAATKGIFSGFAILAVAWSLGLSHHWSLLAVLPVLVLTGMCFAAMGLCFNALARGYDFFSYYFTVILTPMTFLSGVYFPVDALPQWLQVIGRALPLAAAVELARPLALGQAPAGALRSAVILLGYTVVALVLARTLTHRRFAT